MARALSPLQGTHLCHALFVPQLTKEGLQMAITDPKDTLAFHQSRVLSQHLDRSAVPCKMVANAMTKFESHSNKDAVPETEALWFYAMNHGVALISAKRAPLEPLDKWEHSFVDAYFTHMAEKGARAFYYLVRICTRESRHNKSWSTSIPKISGMFGAEVATFFQNAKGSEETIADQFKTLPPAASIGQYVKALQWMFYNASWSGGYGGKKWGQVTDCLVRYVHGEFSAEMMLDTIWTLSHNNGPIFNKGYLYTMYGSDIYRLLDVQRSGQIPTACLHDAKLMKFVDPMLKKAMIELKAKFPDDVPGYIDWEVVEALGSVHKYPMDKSKQAQLYGLSPAAMAAKAATEAKEKAAAEAQAKEQAEHAQNWFQVMPGVEVEKVQIKRAA
jgi:hypothetical protein